MVCLRGKMSGIHWMISLCLFIQTKCETNFNLAVNKPVSASSVHSNAPDRANDGAASTSWSSCFAVHESDNTPWWQVDLQANFYVFKVTVSSRGDCCPERLHDFGLDLYITDPESDSGAQPRRCAFYAGAVTSLGSTVTLNCDQPTYGRFLRIVGENKLNSGDMLQFCEVQVFGMYSLPASSCSTFTLLKGHYLDTPDVENRNASSSAHCATLCEADMSCVGFNAKVHQEVTCQLVKNPDAMTVADLTWDTYTLQRCNDQC